MGRLRVLTFNCWNVSAPFEDRMAVARAAVAALDPDVVALQEIVVRADGFDQSALVLGDLGWARVFGPAYCWDDAGMPRFDAGAGAGFGNVIAARWPIRRSAVRRLPGLDGEEPHAALAALVEAPDGLLPVFTTHLDWEYDHGFVRERQVLALASLVREWAPGATLPPIVAGDLNAEPDSTEVRFLRGLASLEGRSIHLQDAWLAAGDGGPGFTWDNRNPYAAYAGEPDRRIDYVLVGLPARVEAAALAFDAPTRGVLASDHFGVVADVRLPGG
ncbi:MAG TPA: endonuclease/exonuclease/phosphatase family protein [Candidatus Binatia bacterium]|nr:endonuclease/exonuclease/phosphatase family protein [Candidatus Binatia bacterium]